MSDEKPAPGSPVCQLVRRPDPLPHLIPQGGICILAGSPLVGKTALIASMLRAFKDNAPVFGHQPNRVPAVGIVCTDRGWEAGASHWFERVGFPEIPHYTLADDTFFKPKELRKKWDRVERFCGWVDRLKLPEGSLLALDTIGTLVANFLNYDEVQITLMELRAAIRQRHLTLLCTAHSSKLKADKRDRYLRPIDQIAGSTAITGFSDSALYLASPAETGRVTYTLSWSCHTAGDLTIALDRDPNTGVFLLADGGDRATTQRVLALFPTDGTSITMAMLVQLAQRIPLSERTVRRAVDELVAQKCVWKLRRGLYQLAHVLPDDAVGDEPRDE